MTKKEYQSCGAGVVITVGTDDLEWLMKQLVASSLLPEDDTTVSLYLEYRAHGANRTDITRKLDRLGIKYELGETTTTKLDPKTCEMCGQDWPEE